MDGFDRDTGEVMEPARGMPAVPATESRPQNLIFASGDCGQVFGALCTMQGAMEAPKRTKTAKVKGRTRTGADYDYSYAYAPLDEIITCLKAPMTTAGLAYRQFLASREGQWVMRTIIAHQSGEWFGCDYPIFWDESRGMQGFASGVTYARRYGLMLALGIAAEDDDDANVADGQPAQIASGRGGARRSAGKAWAAPEPAQIKQAPPAPLQRTAEPGDPYASQLQNAAQEQTASIDRGARRKAANEWWYAMEKGIKDAEMVKDLDAILASQDWADLDREVREVEDAATADAAMQTLNSRLLQRRNLLLGAQG